MLQKDEYKQAVEAIYWSDNNPFSPKILKKRITTFFKIDGKPLIPFIPDGELKTKIESNIEITWKDFYQPTPEVIGWGMFLIPVTIESEKKKKIEDIKYGVIAASFFLREHKSQMAFEFEIFHL